MPSNRFGSLTGLAWRAAARHAGIDPDAPRELGSEAELLHREVVSAMVNLMDPVSQERGREIYYGWLEGRGVVLRDLVSYASEASGLSELAGDRPEQIPQQLLEYSPLLRHPQHRSTGPYGDPVLSPVTEVHPMLSPPLPAWAWRAAGIQARSR